MKGFDSNWLAERQARQVSTIKQNREALARGPVKARKIVKPKDSGALPAYRIGIDPAFRMNGLGVCVIDPNGNVSFPRFKKRGMVEFVRWLYNEAPQEALVFIEDSNLQKVTFDRTTKGGSRDQINRNIGKNQCRSVDIADFCIDKWGKKCVNAVSPQQKGAKWSQPIFLGVAKQNKHELPEKYRQDDIDAYQLAVRKV